MFKIWVGNLGKYNEGELVGEWVEMPCDDFEEVFERIGINEEYEEIFIADYENDFGYVVDEYEDLDSLNELAERLENLDEYEQAVFEAILDGLTSDEEQALDIIDSQDYMMFWDCTDMSDVAYQYYEETGMLSELEEHISANYIDWEAIGRDMDIEGIFLPCGNGYVEIMGW